MKIKQETDHIVLVIRLFRGKMLAFTYNQTRVGMFVGMFSLEVVLNPGD